MRSVTKKQVGVMSSSLQSDQSIIKVYAVLCFGHRAQEVAQHPTKQLFSPSTAKLYFLLRHSLALLLLSSL